MRHYRLIIISLCFFLNTISLSVAAINNEALVTLAESGDAKAQIQLAKQLKGDKANEQAHYWLLKAALKGDNEAISELGKLFESDSNGIYSTLSLAKNWYLIGNERQLTESEQGYARVLESQFNNKRAKQVASISTLDQQIDDDLAQLEAQPTLPAIDTTSTLNANYLITSLLIIFLLLYIFVKRFYRNKKHSKATSLNLQIAEQNKKIKTLQKHLSLAHSRLKKNQDNINKSKQEQNLSIACAVLGYRAPYVPSEKEIKLRYKKLSRIYHPDAGGSDEEMQRLNAAVKAISHYLKQQTKK
ncbi:hypothetical protein R3X26_07780 [Vibrio sp. TH_r3]|uniref:hypothetical protein n=1 Tax=Vibrio sp. TH_r3 TaxID=3082084 RepID=UPI0029537BA5|nr:hypothetical protein [Vibrio sp. TH_r3]MDV7104305.1 hypothetical protein [Vibrio sp. TH_r3]